MGAGNYSNELFEECKAVLKNEDTRDTVTKIVS